MSERPTQIRVGPYRYNVRWDTPETEGAVGLAFHSTGFIVVDPRMEPIQERDTLLHECLHALANYSGLFRGDDDAEEEFIWRLTPWLLMLIRDNPHLIEYLRS